MAAEHIYITPNAGAHAQELNNAISQQEASRDALVRLKVQMEAMIDGSNYAMVETRFGLPAGTGQTVYNLVAGSVTTLTTDANIVQLIKRLG